MKLKVTYDDGEPTEVTNHAGSPFFTFKIEDGVATLEEDIRWNYQGRHITADLVEQKHEEYNNILVSLRNLPFINSVRLEEPEPQSLGELFG